MDNYLEKVEKLNSLQHVGIKMGLDQVTALLKNIGNPEKTLKFIHVAGTNGKGSVCAILASALSGMGYKIGFYSSPHLVSLRERFRINGKGISRNRLVDLIDYIWPVVEEMYSKNQKITFFEVAVSMAAYYFANEKCDFVLWETGLGGRLDSTNTVIPIVTAITGIGLDHQNFLGDTEGKIAFEKAGIIKNNIPVFVGKMSDSAFHTIKKVALAKTAPFFPIDEEALVFSKESSATSLKGWQYTQGKAGLKLAITKVNNNSYSLPLSGGAQPNNMLLAYSILEYLSGKLGFCLDEAFGGIEKLKWYGRIQQLPDGKILDGAHNPQGIKSLVETLCSSFGNEKFSIVFGCLEERNPRKALSLLSQIAAEFIFIPINSSKSCFLPEKMLIVIDDIGCTVPCSVMNSLTEALSHSVKSGRKVLITGSLYLAGETLLEYFTEDELVNI